MTTNVMCVTYQIFAIHDNAVLGVLGFPFRISKLKKKKLFLSHVLSSFTNIKVPVKRELLIL